MSSDIWTQCARRTRARTLELEAWRCVESQHQTSTRKLVESSEEQAILEELLDERKPAPPSDPACARLHYLLFTPFRYPPLRHGSRFGSTAERGLWYGSETRRTLFSEVAYYRLVFLEGTDAALGAVETIHTAFTASIRTARGIDLTRPPFDEYRARLASRTLYDDSQTLGAGMRTAGIEAFRYSAARDREGGVNVGVFACKAFASPVPGTFETWHCYATRDSVEVSRDDYVRRVVHRFERNEFLVGGRLPSPAV